MATAFVLQDSGGREFDTHAMRLDAHNNGIPAWGDAEGFIFERQDLSGLSVIAGSMVECIPPEAQMRCHLGYDLPEKQFLDLNMLHRKFGVDYPGWADYLR